MKVIDILADSLTEATKHTPAKLTVGDLVFDPDHVGREGFKLPNSYLTVAPEGKAPSEWKYNEDFRINAQLKVTSLKGCPTTVTDTFDYSGYSDTIGIPDLVGGPTWTRSYSIQAHTLVSLEGAPRKTTYFSINSSKLKSLKHSPLECDSYSLYDCTSLKSLEGITPKLFRLTLSNCKNITNFKNIHKYVQELQILALSDMDNFKSHILGVLLIPKMQEIIYSSFDDELKAVITILNKYLPNTKGNDAVMECQNELIDAGFDEYAQL